MINNNYSYSYDDIAIIPMQKSNVKSRSNVDLTTKIDIKSHLKVPIVASPMDTVCDYKMASYMNSIGGVGIIHRFQSIEKQGEDFKNAMNDVNPNNYNNIGVAVGVTGDYKERLDFLISIYKDHIHNKHTSLWICFDTANGYTSMMEEAVMYLRNSELYDTNNMVIVAGNISSENAYEFLYDIGVDVVRVGIGSGSACSTSGATGVGAGMISVIDSIVKRRNRMITRNNLKNEQGPFNDRVNYRYPLIMADGGLRSSGDVVKVLAVGADLVMLGRLLAGYDESAGEIVSDIPNLQYFGNIVGRGEVYYSGNKEYRKDQIKWYKKFRGLASPSAAKISKELNGDSKFKNAEGIETIVSYKGPINTFMMDFLYGIKSGFSYVGSSSIEEFRKYFNENPDSIVLLSQNAIIEKQPKYHKEN